MSSTEPYPEVNVDESGIVPAQTGRAPEWPKKIRTLTATELDRLTIDDTGHVRVPDRPGFGFELDHERIEHHTVAVFDTRSDGRGQAIPARGDPKLGDPLG